MTTTETLPISPGLNALRAALKDIPPAPGIYKMLGADGKILYIGKAKSLINRVTSYTNTSNLNNRILRMVSQIAAVETIVTKNEAEALLIEASLVRRHRPRYNVLLKDDKSFPYIRIDTSHPFPRIEKHRGAQTKPGEYFGPFASVGALNETLALLQKIFQLRPCADNIFKNRSRPCLQYQIKRCTAPCVGYVDSTHYAGQVNTARNFLKGKHRDIQDALTAQMNEASAAMEYERAGALRDRIRALTQVQQEQGLRVAGLDNADVIALARRGDKSVAQVFFFRDGAHFGNQSFHPRHETEESDGEILSQFIAQFYQSHLPPQEIMINLALEEKEVLCEALAIRAGHKVELWQPSRGDKLTLVTNAATNAQAALKRLEMERASVESHLLALKKIFGLKAQPLRIEVYDNSHIMGTNAIGAFIVATPEGFDKKSYRSFNIKDANPGDDFGMMREVFRRRFKGVAPISTVDTEMRSASAPLAAGVAPAGGEGGVSPPSEKNLPDLILIDGGIGQLHAVEEALKEIGVEGLALVAIAKGEDRNAGREWFHQPGTPPFQLPVNDPILHYLERLRDEAHRFAIGRHRGKRSKSLTTSALDDIPGIGAARKRALLQHFGSRADVETATIAELQNVKGINKTTAQGIYDYFHG